MSHQDIPLKIKSRCERDYLPVHKPVNINSVSVKCLLVLLTNKNGNAAEGYPEQLEANLLFLSANLVGFITINTE